MGDPLHFISISYKMFLFLFLFLWCACGGWRTGVWSQFPPSFTFAGVLQIKLRSSGLGSCLAGPY